MLDGQSLPGRKMWFKSSVIVRQSTIHSTGVPQVGGSGTFRGKQDQAVKLNSL